MSDNLSDRIAAAIFEAWMEGADDANALADAVIRDLGLRQETEPANKYRDQSTRIVSDWKETQ